MLERFLTFAVTPGSHPGHQIVTLKGQLTFETVKHFQDTLRADLTPVVILDMHDVDFLDSAGVGALVNAHVGFEKTHQRLAIAAPSVRVKAAIEVAALHQVLAIFPTIADAEQQLV